MIGSTDIVVEETWIRRQPQSGLPIIQHSVQRNHDAGSVTNKLSSSTTSSTVSGTATNGRVQMSATWYDDYDRPIESVQLGNNGGSSFARNGASVAARSDTYLRTSTSYDDFGRVKDVTDVHGIVNRTEYDGMGRRSRTIENYVNGTPGGGSYNDEDRVVEYAYTPSTGTLDTVTRKMPSSGDDQVTTYVYGTSVGTGSQIETGHLLFEVIYPEQYTSQPVWDRTAFSCYNALGQVIRSFDPAGNDIETTYDNAGRATSREVLSFAAGFDTRVVRIETTYTDRGQLDTARQLDGMSTVLDETVFTYDDWGNLASMTQDPDSAVGVSGRAAFVTGWTWSKKAATGDWQVVTLDQVNQPGGLQMNSSFGSGVDTSMGRVARWTDQLSTPLADYVYMGAGTVVSTLLGEPNVQTAMYAGGGSSDYPTYMDRFNRTIKNQWEKLGATPNAAVFVDFSVTAYNRYGQPMAVEDKVLGTGQASLGDPLVRRFDARMTYDSLRRVIERKEGELSSPTAFASTSREQVLTRMLSGVAITDQVDLDGNGVYTDNPPEIDNGEMDDSSRTYNDRNELVQRVVADVTGTNTYDLTYDLNGNLTSDDEKYDYVYNPFGQLVQVKLTGTSKVAANYTYNALGHRNSEQTDTNDTSTPPGSGIPDGDTDAFDPVFFIATDLQGRRVATFRDTDSDPKECFAYHAPSGFGKTGATGPILRTRNSSEQVPTNWATTSGSNTHDERYYYTSDLRGNVTAIVSSGGNFIEQYRYSATGVPMGIPRGDVNSDGQVVGAGLGDADFEQANYIDKTTYHVRTDWNLDGDIDSTDLAVVVAQHGAMAGRKGMSDAAVSNRLPDDWREDARLGGLLQVPGTLENATIGVSLSEPAISQAISRSSPSGSSPSGGLQSSPTSNRRQCSDATPSDPHTTAWQFSRSIASGHYFNLSGDRYITGMSGNVTMSSPMSPSEITIQTRLAFFAYESLSPAQPTRWPASISEERRRRTTPQYAPNIGDNDSGYASLKTVFPITCNSGGPIASAPTGPQFASDSQTYDSGDFALVSNIFYSIAHTVSADGASTENSPGVVCQKFKACSTISARMTVRKRTWTISPGIVIDLPLPIPVDPASLLPIPDITFTYADGGTARLVANPCDHFTFCCKCH